MNHWELRKVDDDFARKLDAADDQHREKKRAKKLRKQRERIATAVLSGLTAWPGDTSRSITHTVRSPCRRRSHRGVVQVTPREAADVIADLVFQWTHLVLSVEDRDMVSEIVKAVNPPEPECLTCARNRAARA